MIIEKFFGQPRDENKLIERVLTKKDFSFNRRKSPPRELFSSIRNDHHLNAPHYCNYGVVATVKTPFKIRVSYKVGRDFREVEVSLKKGDVIRY